PKPADVRPAPYYLRDGSVTKHCAATGKWRGTWVVECKQVGVKPVPTPEPSQTATPEPSQSTRTTPANPRGPRDASCPSHSLSSLTLGSGPRLRHLEPGAFSTTTRQRGSPNWPTSARAQHRPPGRGFPAAPPLTPA